MRIRTLFFPAASLHSGALEHLLLISKAGGQNQAFQYLLSLNYVTSSWKLLFYGLQTELSLVFFINSSKEIRTYCVSYKTARNKVLKIQLKTSSSLSSLLFVDSTVILLFFFFLEDENSTLANSSPHLSICDVRLKIIKVGSNTDASWVNKCCSAALDVEN